ncbi:MAG: hypothetical protein WC942_11170 [Clostridia bacterium]|jgi:hypothetical protein
MNSVKLKIAQERLYTQLDDILPYSFSKTLRLVIKRRDIECNDSFFDFVYRAYHCSFKVMWMTSFADHFIGLVSYLFLEEVPVDFFEDDRFRVTGFSSVSERYPKKLSLLFKKNSFTYTWLNKVLKIRPKINQYHWEDWSKHHLEMFGITFWYIATSVSLLGILGHKEKKSGIITYTEGIKNYVISDLNFKGIEKLNKRKQVKNG